MQTFYVTIPQSFCAPWHKMTAPFTQGGLWCYRNLSFFDSLKLPPLDESGSLCYFVLRFFRKRSARAICMGVGCAGLDFAALGGTDALRGGCF